MALPGTKHQTLIDRLELSVFEALQHVRGIKKVKAERIEWTGPTRPRLQLRSGRFAQVVEAWLYVGAAKRKCRIFLEAGMHLEGVRGSLEEMLAGFGLDVEMFGDQGGGIKQENLKGVNMTDANEVVVNNSLTMTPEEQWAWCELIYESVKNVKELSEKEAELELQMEIVRDQKEQVKVTTMGNLNQVLRPGGGKANKL